MEDYFARKLTDSIDKLVKSVDRLGDHLNLIEDHLLGIESSVELMGDALTPDEG